MSLTDKTLGHYHIVERIGAGGMGEVYRARDDRLGRDVAIKVLPASGFRDPDARARLLREARAAAALNHPHICTIHEVGEGGRNECGCFLCLLLQIVTREKVLLSAFRQTPVHSKSRGKRPLGYEIVLRAAPSAGFSLFLCGHPALTRLREPRIDGGAPGLVLVLSIG